MHGKLDAVKISKETRKEFFDRGTKLQAKKMKVDPERVASFCDANNICFEKRWLCVAAKDFHDKNENSSNVSVNEVDGENMFPKITSEEEEDDDETVENEDEEEDSDGSLVAEEGFFEGEFRRRRKACFWKQD